MISSNKEDYLRAMYHLWEENEVLIKVKHFDETNVKSNEIASYLQVSRPSVSRMMNTLEKDGFVQFQRYGKLKFTKKGEELAKNITAKHRIIELFLTEQLKIKGKKVHNLAHKLEHAFDDECISKLKKLLNNPKKDPHGKPIPR